MNNPQDNYGNFNTIDIDKQKLLNILQKNKETHNALYNISLSGYYVKADEYRNKVVNFSEEAAQKWQSLADDATKSLGQFNFGKPIDILYQPHYSKSYPTHPSFPVSYENYYNEAITKLELSIHDTFRLSEQEFQNYVMNNWSWKNAFKQSSYGYLENTCYITGLMPLGTGLADMRLSVSGCLNNF